MATAFEEITAELLEKWASQSPVSAEVNDDLARLVAQHPAKTFPVLRDDAREAFAAFVCSCANDVTENLTTSERSLLLRLQLLRICLRDKRLANSECCSSSVLTMLFRATSLMDSDADGDDGLRNLFAFPKVVLEADRCLMNLLYNSPTGRERLLNGPFDRLLARVALLAPLLRWPVQPGEEEEEGAEIKQPAIEYLQYLQDSGAVHNATNWTQLELEEFLGLDMKICFVVTAQEKKLQLHCLKDPNKLLIFQQIIDLALERIDAVGISPPPSLEEEQKAAAFERQYINDALLTLFTLYHNLHREAEAIDSKSEEMQDCVKNCSQVCARVLQHSLLDMEIKQNAVNVLATISETLPALCPKIDLNNVSEKEICASLAFEGYDMHFVDTLLRFLEAQVTKYEGVHVPALGEHLVMFLQMMTSLCTAHKAARRFCRLKVLPPLTADDVGRRPDQGMSFRNKLVRLMTKVGFLKEANADFLFVLCKRSAGRLVKYTGFGHAAGLLADRGILGQGLSPMHPSDSEDSETDDYREVENRVDPVSGHIPSPEQLEEMRRQFQSMTEEQKEHEAMKLVDAIDKLMGQGVIAPGTVGEDGQLRAVKHVAELIKDVKPGKGECSSDDEED